MQTSFKSILTKFVTTYPHLLSNSKDNDENRLIRAQINEVESTADLKKVSSRFMSQLNQFMISMKVVYPILPEPEQLNEFEFMEPDWIKTMLQEFNGIKSELQWFNLVKRKLSANFTISSQDTTGIISECQDAVTLKGKTKPITIRNKKVTKKGGKKCE